MFVGVRESKFVFIEMEPDGRSKAEQGMSEFGFITDTVGHFLFIFIVMPFWASARLWEQSHSWVDPLLRTLHFSHFAGLTELMLSGKKTYWLEWSLLQHLGFYWSSLWGVFSHLVEVQVVFVLTHLVNSAGFSALVSLSHFIHSPCHLPRALLLGLKHAARSPQLLWRAFFSSSSSSTF